MNKQFKGMFPGMVPVVGKGSLPLTVRQTGFTML